MAEMKYPKSNEAKMKDSVNKGMSKAAKNAAKAVALGPMGLMASEGVSKMVKGIAKSAAEFKKEMRGGGGLGGKADYLQQIKSDVKENMPKEEKRLNMTSSMKRERKPLKEKSMKGRNPKA